MAGRIVRDPNGKGSAFGWPSGGEQLAHVSYACAHPHRSRVPFGMILPQMSVLLHDRSATRRVDGDKRGTRALERRDVAPRERSSRLEIAGMCVERAAAVLPWRIDCRVAVDDQHASGGAIR